MIFTQHRYFASIEINSKEAFMLSAETIDDLHKGLLRNFSCDDVLIWVALETFKDRQLTQLDTRWSDKAARYELHIWELTP